MIGLPAPVLLSVSDTAAAVDPLALLLAAAALLLAMVGSLAASALLAYSPSKLARRAGARRVRHVQSQEVELRLAAWLTALGGLTGAVLAALASHVDAWVLAALTLAAAYGCGALPLATAERRAESIVLLTFPVLRVVRAILRYPLLVPLLALTRWTLRAMGIPEAPPTDPDEIADEIMAAVTDSAADTALRDKEKAWIENIVELEDRHVSEVMTPRTDVVAFEANTDLREAVARATEAGFSRYPIYEGNIDKVVGVFYAKDALARLGNGAATEVRVADIARPPLFAPASMAVIELLEQFKTTKVQMAVVLDEYGGTAGVITLEDILEEIVGDISDEYDQDEEQAITVVEKDRVVEISGKARVEEVNEALGVSIPQSPEYDTVAGYLFTTLGKIPKIGETHSVDGVRLEVLEADDRRISKIRLTVLTPQAESA